VWYIITWHKMTFTWHWMNDGRILALRREESLSLHTCCSALLYMYNENKLSNSASVVSVCDKVKVYKNVLQFMKTYVGWRSIGLNVGVHVLRYSKSHVTYMDVQKKHTNSNCIDQTQRLIILNNRTAIVWFNCNITHVKKSNCCNGSRVVHIFLSPL
jgi:hypothetical protein